MSNEAVLVLGSAGFIGSAVVNRLVDLHYRVYAIGHTEATEQEGQLVRIQGSIEDSRLLKEALARCRYVIYAASRTTPGTSAREPELEVISNLLPLSRLLESIAECSKKKMIYLSSAGAIYGDLAKDADETSILRPRSYYGAGKASAEAFIHACTTISDTEAIILRPTNLYGPCQHVGKGFAIVPTLFQCAHDGKPFQVWGDGGTMRDYCYIDDLVEAMVLLLKQPAAGNFSVYNIASGQSATIIDLIRLCERASGRSIAVEFQAPRGIDVAHVSPRYSALTMAYGWQARISLEEGLRRTWAWFSDNAAKH